MVTSTTNLDSPPVRNTDRDPRRVGLRQKLGRWDVKLSPYLYISPFFILFAVVGLFPLAYTAYVASRPSKPEVKVAGSQFSDAQLFFLGYAQSWCSKRRDEDARMRVTVDPHSPPRWRVNGVVANTPAFAKAFSCGPKAPMVKEKACVVW